MKAHPRDTENQVIKLRKEQVRSRNILNLAPPRGPQSTEIHSQKAVRVHLTLASQTLKRMQAPVELEKVRTPRKSLKKAKDSPKASTAEEEKMV